MQLNYGDASLLLITRDRNAQGPCVVVTVGLICNADQTLVAADDAQGWLAERFADQPFDRGLKKMHGTFAVQGSAYALTAAQQAGMAIRVSVGSLSKTLHVHPPRQWRKGLLGWSPVVCGELTRVPVDLQHAYGAADSPDNPQGIGYTLTPDKAEGLALPQIESERVPLRAPGEAAPVASFLPLLPQSRERHVFMGRCDQAWTRQHAPFLPLDTDSRWFDEVVQDQVQAGYWTGAEAWSVAGMHPQHVEIRGRLPGLRPRLFVEREPLDSLAAKSAIALVQRVEEPRLELDTLWLFPDVERVLLLYRAHIQVRDIDGDDLLALSVGCERAAEPVKSREQWIAELWSHPVDSESETHSPEPAPALEQPKEQAQWGIKLESEFSAYSVEHDKHLALAEQAEKLADPAMLTQATEAMTRNLMAYLPKLQMSLATVNNVFSTRLQPVAAVSPPLADDILAFVDANDFEAKIEALAGPNRVENLIADSEAALHRQVEDLAALLDKPVAGLLSEIEASGLSADESVAKAQIDTLFSDTHLDEAVAELEASLQQYVEQTANELGIPAAQLLAQVKARDALAQGVEATEAPPAHQGQTDDLPAPTPHEWTRELLAASLKDKWPLDEQRFVALDLAGMNLNDASMRHCVFERCQLSGVSMVGADLSASHFIDCDLASSDLRASRFDDALFERCTMQGVRAGKASFKEAYGLECRLEGADFEGVEGQQTQWVECSFLNARLQTSDWSGSRWLSCDLSGVSLVNATGRRTQFQSCLLDTANLARSDFQGASWSGVQGANVDLSDVSLSQWRLDQDCQLPSARFDGADLGGASLQHATLTQSSFRGACLAGAFISHCDMSGSTGYRVDARGADFTASDLSGISWVSANLLEANLRKVNLAGADLRGANLHGVVTEGAKGMGVRLESALLTRCRLMEDLARV